MKHRIRKGILYICIFASLNFMPTYASSVASDSQPIKTEDVDRGETERKEESSVEREETDNSGNGIKNGENGADESIQGDKDSEDVPLLPRKEEDNQKNILEETEDKKDDTQKIDWFSKKSLIQVILGTVLGASAAVLFFVVWSVQKSRYADMECEECEENRESTVRREVQEEKKYNKEEPRKKEAERRKSTSLVSTVKLDDNSSRILPDSGKGTIGKVHHMGNRRNQQDTLGVNLTGKGLLAVVSDGMGGLAGGEKVSQKAVMGMFQAVGQTVCASGENPLFTMLSETNDQVLSMLGPDQIYKSGATLLAVLANNGYFHWVAVGDSRIYFYCSHHLLQLNREHVYKQELIKEAVNKNISFNRILSDPQRDRLVSFLGMGELKYIDGSLRPISVKQGDKVLLMSDGIFNTISENEIIWILEHTNNAEEAAALMEKQVLGAGNPKQDNFTCVILDF